jgi:hypothetical protein
MQGYLHAYAAVSQIALAAAGRLGDDLGLGWTHRSLGLIYYELDSYDESIAHNLRAVHHLKLAGAIVGQGYAHVRLNTTHWSIWVGTAMHEIMPSRPCACSSRQATVKGKR